jgi:endonuclease/exonuclease/phosphatase family metal-dependent hydrolase
MPNDWDAWADSLWATDPDRPGFYAFYAAALRSLNADVIALQELKSTQGSALAPFNPKWREIVPTLADSLGMYYYQQEYSKFHGFAFLSKYPIISDTNFSVRTPYDGMIRITIQTDNGSVLSLYNLHQTYKGSTERTLDAEMNLLQIQLENLNPHIILGDFNVYIEDMESGIPTEMQRYIDAGYNWQGYEKDYILTNNNTDRKDFREIRNQWTDYETESFNLGDTAASDHLPVWAKIRF